MPREDPLLPMKIKGKWSQSWARVAKNVGELPKTCSSKPHNHPMEYLFVFYLETHLSFLPAVCTVVKIYLKLSQTCILEIHYARQMTARIAKIHMDRETARKYSTSTRHRKRLPCLVQLHAICLRERKRGGQLLPKHARFLEIRLLASKNCVRPKIFRPRRL